MSLSPTSLYKHHIKLNGRMVDFSGWSLPIQYTSIIKEHLSVREHAGVFDTSHMGEVLIIGKDTEDFIDYLITNDFKHLKIGKCLYSPICYEHGGVVDDVIVYKFNREKAIIVVNAANIVKDVEWMNKVIALNHYQVELNNMSLYYDMLAVQGPKAMAYISKLIPQAANLPLFSFIEFSTSIGNILVKGIFSTTGYTGEGGGEFYLHKDDSPIFMDFLLEEGITPCGLGARDSLRLEKGYSLYGHELAENKNVIESGLGWTVKMDKNDFIGKKALIDFQPKNKLVGFIMEDRAVARQGAQVLGTNIKNEVVQLGEVTSGTYSPCLKKNIGLAFISKDFLGKDILIDIRGKKFVAKLTKRNFL